MLTLLPLLIAVGAGIIAGVFFAFSNFVMKALGHLPAEHGVAAMQRVNVVVMNPLFLAVFVGTALLCGIVAVGAFFSWGTARAALLLMAGASYLVGCFGVTAACNVPRNERLARLAPASSEAGAYWPVYLREWLWWNHVRTAAAVVTSAAAAWALAH